MQFFYHGAVPEKPRPTQLPVSRDEIADHVVRQITKHQQVLRRRPCQQHSFMSIYLRLGLVRPLIEREKADRRALGNAPVRKSRIAPTVVLNNKWMRYFRGHLIRYNYKC